jgi:hypothetical protein
MSEWISVTERMPKIGAQVDLWVTGEADLISFYCAPYCAATSGRLTDIRFTREGWMHIGGLRKKLTAYLSVTHWMPVPEPPMVAGLPV